MGQKPSLTSGRQVEEPHLPPRKLLPEFVGDSHSAEATLTAPSNSNGIDSAFDPLSSFSESPSLFKKTEGDTVESLDGGDVSGNLPLISQGSIMEKASNIRKKNMQNGSPRAGVAASPADGKKTLNPRPQADLQTFKSSKEIAKELIYTLKLVGEWRLLSLLGSGGMAYVYLAQHQIKPSSYCAIKLSRDYIEDIDNFSKDPCFLATISEWQSFKAIDKTLPAEKVPDTKIPADWGSDTVQTAGVQRVKKSSAGSLQAQKVGSGKGGLPAAYEFGFVRVGNEKHSHGYIALQLLGWNLHAVATDKQRPLSWSSFYRLATGMLDSARLLHCKGFVHRDIKPANYCLASNGQSRQIYLVDFGFVKPLPQKGTSGEAQFCGTPDFASTDALKSKRCGAKDDCESLCYTILQLWNGGHLPWDITRRTTGHDPSEAVETSSDIWTPENLKIMANKRVKIWEALVANGGIPKFLISWNLYLDSLTNWQLPNYDLLHKLLRNSWVHWQTGGKMKSSRKEMRHCASGGIDEQQACMKKFKTNPLMAAEE